MSRPAVSFVAAAWLMVWSSGASAMGLRSFVATKETAGSGALLLLSGWLMYRPGRACPADPELGRLCDQTQVWNRRIYWSSVALWGIGFFAAYLALPLRIWLDF